MRIVLHERDSTAQEGVAELTYLSGPARHLRRHVKQNPAILIIHARK
jgi:hypothetical protein